MATQTQGDGTVPVETAAKDSAATAGQHGAASTEHASGGLPQFEFQHWGGQIAYLLVLFALLYVLMSRVFAPRIRRVFEARATAISGALASARSVQAEAAAQAEVARQTLADARSRAMKAATDAKAKVAEEAKTRSAALEAELSAKLKDAEMRISAARDSAMGSVKAVAAEAAQAMVQKLTGTTASDEAVTAALAEVRG